MSQLTGIGRRMPLTMAAFALAAFMLAGLPPGAGFVSKWLLLLGGLEASAWVAVVALLASTVLNIAYFAPIVVRAGCGVLCDPTDPADIARAIRSIIDAPDAERVALRMRALASARREFSWQHQVQELLRVYREIGVAPTTRT